MLTYKYCNRKDIIIQTKQRHILFLQGPLSSYYAEIARRVKKTGTAVTKVHFCGNDIVDWRHKNALHFRDSFQAWPKYLTNLIQKHNITDIVMHGDQRPYHKIAVQIAHRQNIRIWVTEMGYLRPDWMTIEPDGISTLSKFTNKPDRLLELDQKDNNDIPIIYEDSTISLMAQEARFTIFNFLFSPYFRHYKSHRVQPQLKLYTGWLSSKISKLLSPLQGKPDYASREPYFVMALQLDGDLQLTQHSPFQSMYQAIKYVMASFSKFAPKDTYLVLKTHPQAFNTRYLIAKTKILAANLNISDRVYYEKGSTVSKLCTNATGFVTVNSSAGFEALETGCPTCCIMPTIYDVDGLTHAGKLDYFWSKPKKPNNDLLKRLRKTLINTIQVRGTLYNRNGRKAAAIEVADKIFFYDWIKTPVLEKTPPRITQAAEMGITFNTQLK